MILGFCYGCFDLLHQGHVRFLDRAAAQCDYLIVGLASDEACTRWMGPNRPYQTFVRRMRNVWPFAGTVVQCDDPEAWLQDLKPEVFILGSQQKFEGIAHCDRVAYVRYLPHLTSTPVPLKGPPRMSVGYIDVNSAIRYPFRMREAQPGL